MSRNLETENNNTLTCIRKSKRRSAIRHPGEPKNGGHVTITHQMSASLFRAFRTRSLLRSEKIL